MLPRIHMLILLISALCLSACATIDYEAFNANLESGESSAIIAQYAGSANMSSATLRLRNKTEGLIYTRSFYASGPIATQVKPGTYEILSGTTSGYNMSGNLPLIRAWYKDFEVKPGEIVDIGKFGFKPFDVKTSAGTTAGKVWNALNSFGLSTKHQTSYVTYYIEPIKNTKIQKQLDKNFSANKSKLVSKPLELRLSENEFRKIILDAAAPDAEGKVPTYDEADKRIREGLRKYLIQSLTNDLLNN